MKFNERINSLLGYLDRYDLYPDRVVIDYASSGPELLIDGEKKIIFCSSNYLGLANDPRVVSALQNAAEEYGHGSCGSRLISGTTSAHIELERQLAKYKGAEAAIVFSAGMLVNMGVIPSIFNIPDVELGAAVRQKIRSFFIKQSAGAIFSDQLNHASIIDGSRLSSVKKYVFNHRNYEQLTNFLKRDKSETKLIITDGVFSMDGDEADLKKLVELKNRYNALLMVDDAHATGVLGKNGRGTHEKQGVELKDVDLYMGTLSKAFGGIGGFLVGRKNIVEYMRISARTYIFNGSIPAACAKAVLEAMKIAESEAWRRERVLMLAEKFQNEVSRLGFKTVNSTTHIVPILIGDETLALKFSRKLFENGFLSPAIRWPATAKRAARIRISFMSTHTDEHIESLLSSFKSIGNNLGVI